MVEMNDVLTRYPMNLFEILFENEVPTLPDDAEASLEYVLKLMERQSKRSVDILRYYHRDGMTYEQIGKLYMVTRERIRQIEQRTIRQLRHPARLDWIEYGVSGMIERKAAESREAGRRGGVLEGMEYKLDDMPEAAGPKLLTIEELDLSVRSYHCLQRAGVKTIADIFALGKDKLKDVRNLGKKSQWEIIQRLQEVGYDTTALE